MYDENTELVGRNLLGEPPSLSRQEQSLNRYTIDRFSNSLSLFTSFLADVSADSGRLFRIGSLANSGTNYRNGPVQLETGNEADTYEEEDEEWDEWSDEE